MKANKFRFTLKVKWNGYTYIHTQTNNEAEAWEALDRAEEEFPCELWDNDQLIWVVL